MLDWGKQDFWVHHLVSESCLEQRPLPTLRLKLLAVGTMCLERWVYSIVGFLLSSLYNITWRADSSPGLSEGCTVREQVDCERSRVLG